MENAFSEKYKYAFRNLELKELRRFILKELISSPELDNQLTNLMVLGIASLAMPQLTLLSAAATGIGLAFGGKSLADIFSEHKAHKNEIQILEKTPVSLLYGAYKKK
ncbi:hypothetical protein GP259_000748 [Salmonella enterica]|nr:hypothetical protein [Salmonella enterica]